MPDIKPIKNGPLLVKDLGKLTNSRDEEVKTSGAMTLCRCGASKKKPFCDGSHVHAGFDDKKSSERVPDKKESYKGKDITIHDNRGICSHAGFCTDNLPQVFMMGVEPWINPDGADKEDIKRVIHMCPSGALSYTEPGQKEVKDFSNESEIHISRNGPYYVRGNIEINNTDLGDGASKEHYTLCRCGASGNKPRCDGSHWYAAFKDNEGLTISAANRRNEESKEEWIKVAEPDELQDNGTLKINIDSHKILLSRVGDKIGAVDGICTHQGGPIIDSAIEKGVIRCPWHGHPFDPISGKSLANDPDLKNYQTESREDGIYIKFTHSGNSGWTISHVVAETMVNWGIKHVFGMVGHSNLGIADAIRVQEEKGKLQYIGIRHECAAAFACSGYAKASGKPAACLSISGPGATNLLTGLWDANVDRAPVLAITGQVNTQFFGPGSFQEIELKKAFSGVSPFSHLILPDSNHARLTSLAMKNAIVRRTVSHLIFPNDVQTLDAGEEAPGYPDGWLSGTGILPDQKAVDLAVYRIANSKRPAVIVGYGARESMTEIIAFAEKINAPVLTTFKAKGQIPDDHPLATGVLGKSGTPVSAYFMNSSDLLIVFGASFSQHTGIDASKPLIQVDNDRMALAKFHGIDSPVWGDAALTAERFTEKLSGISFPENRYIEIKERRESWRKEKEKLAESVNDKGLNEVRIFSILSSLLPSDALISLDVGNNTYSFGRYFECRDQRVILSGYLGSIGFAFPAALGAYYAGTGRPVVSISGDGGFGQYMSEFNTAVLYNINTTHILLNNNELGKISDEQRDENLKIWKTELHNPDFSRFALNCGGLGIRVSDIEELKPAVEEALAYNGPSLVEIVTDPKLS